MKISVVIPAYNESERIADTIKKVHFYLSNHKYDFEIIVVDDGSVDDTYQKARLVAATLDRVSIIHYSRNRGKGFAVRKGVLSAQKEFVLFLDADLSIPIEEIEKFKDWFGKGCQIVIGSRRVKEANLIKKMSPLRSFLGKGYASLSNSILGTSITDFNCGFKMFSKEAFRALFPLQRLRGWGFDCEIIFIAAKNGFELREIPIKYIHRDDTKVRVIRAMASSFVELLTIRFNWLIGEYRIKRR